MRDVLEGHAEFVGSGAQTVDRGARPLQNITGKAEQAAPALGLHHLLGSEAKAVQVLDQRGSLARIGDSGGLQRIEIDHYLPPRLMSKVVTGASKPLSVKGSCGIAFQPGSASRISDEARICPGDAAATNRAAKFTALPK